MLTMDRNNDIISSNQLAAILSVTIVGVGILSLPRTAVEAVGPDALIIVILGSIIALIHGLLIAYLVGKHPKDTLVEFSSSLLGKVLGGFVSLGFVVYLIIFSAVEVRVFGEVTKQYLLFQTPIEVLGISFLLGAVFLVRAGIEPIARMSEIIFPVATLVAIVAVLPILGELDLTYFLPIFRTPLPKIAMGVTSIFFSYIGIEMTLVLAAFVTDQKKIKRSIWITVGLVSFFYLSITAITISRFGLVETTHIIWPVLELFKTVDIPGAFIQNIEAFIMTIWIMSVYMTLVVVYYGATLTLSRLIKSKEHNYLVLPLMPIIYYLALVPDNVAQLTMFMDKYAFYMGTFYVSIVPVGLIGITLFKKKKGGSKGA